jgi:hypothetical protein
MKKVILIIFVFLLGLPLLTAQNNNTKKDPVGSWKFEAPYAPEGYSSGTLVVGKEAQKYTTTVSLTGNEYKLTGEKVKAVSDSLSFSIFLEGQDIRILLKVTDETKMSGKAVYSEGEIPVTLTKNTNPAKM